MNKRITGLDFARGVAVWGMIFMNFKIVLSNENIGILATVSHFMEGHFGVMFVILAGMGISLFMKKSYLKGDIKEINKKKQILFKRSIFLIVIGLLFSFVWPADILHYYGFYIMLGLLFLNLSDKVLWVAIIVTTAVFPILFLLISYESGWNFDNLAYVDFWSIGGFLRNTFFNGFHPIFPWIAFLFLGIIIGRKDLTKISMKKYLGVSLVIAVLAESLSFFLTGQISSPMNLVFSRDAMPPGPLFVIAGGAEGIFMIFASFYLSRVLKESIIIKPLVYTGQMVLSHYIIHVFIGLGFLELIGQFTEKSLLFSLIYSSIYFVFSVLFSFLWAKKFNRGPFELLMRKVAG